MYNVAKLLIVAGSGACPVIFNSLIAADKLGALYPNLPKAAILSAPDNVPKYSMSFCKEPLVPCFCFNVVLVLCCSCFYLMFFFF